MLWEGELAKLIRLTEGSHNPDGSRNYVPCSFGPGWVGLKWRKAEWALEHIAKWRGIEAKP